MDVSSVMSTYNSSSLWSSLNSGSTSSLYQSGRVSSNVSDSYSAANLSDGATSSALQDIYQTVQNDYGIGLTYDSSGNIATSGTINTSDLPTVSELTNSLNSNFLSSFNSLNSTDDSSVYSLLSESSYVQSGAYNNVYAKLYSSSATTAETSILGSALDVSV